MKNVQFFLLCASLMLIHAIHAMDETNTEVPVATEQVTIQEPQELENTDIRTKIAEQPLPTGTPGTEDILNSFLRPVKFTKTGVQDFFTTTFNTPLYAERFLPSCFLHVVDFMEYGADHEKPYDYYKSIFDLFHQRLKESTWVNPYAFISFLERIPEYLDFIPEHSDAELKETLREELENSLVEKFALLKEDPDTFLEETSGLLASAVKQAEGTSSIKGLQCSFTRFLEGAIGKLVWNPFDKIDVWKSFKLIAKKCELLYYYGILSSMEDVNQLIWSLLYRFGYFIDCAGSQMKYDFYRTIRNEMKTQNFTFLNIDEQEEWITTKKDYFDKILTEGEVKSHAYDQGIFSE